MLVSYFARRLSQLKSRELYLSEILLAGGPSYPWLTGSICRIGRSRVCSSITCAMSPGVRAIMKMPLNATGFIPRSARIAPIAPSTLIGSDFFVSANAFSTARLHLHAVHAGFARKLEQTFGARVLGVEAMTFCQRLGDNALQLSSLATVHQSIREFPPLNDYSSR